MTEQSKIIYRNCTEQTAKVLLDNLKRNALELGESVNYMNFGLAIGDKLYTLETAE